MKTYYALMLFFFLGFPSKAQFINDGGNIDQQTYNFGFSLALNYGSFQVVKRDDYHSAFTYYDVNDNAEEVESLAAIRSIGKPGFSLGLLANLILTGILICASRPTSFSWTGMWSLFIGVPMGGAAIRTGSFPRMRPF